MNPILSERPSPRCSLGGGQMPPSGRRRYAICLPEGRAALSGSHQERPMAVAGY